MSDPIYLDHNATTPIDSEVVEAMLPWLREHFGNPSSTHIYGRRAHEASRQAGGDDPPDRDVGGERADGDAGVGRVQHQARQHGHALAGGDQ